MNECAVSADEVYPEFFGRAVQGAGDFNEITFSTFCDHGDGGHGYALVDDGDAVFLLDGLAGADEVSPDGGYLVIDART